MEGGKGVKGIKGVKGEKGVKGDRGERGGWDLLITFGAQSRGEINEGGF